MSRRKFEIAGHMNERDFSHLVELELPPGGFRNRSHEFESFESGEGALSLLHRWQHDAVEQDAKED
jgi:hypothetical protein